MSARARRRAASSGVAATEFVLILPILLIMLFGMINVTSIMNMGRRIDVAAYLVADLVTRESSVDVATLTEFVLAADLSLRPLAAGTTRIDIYDYSPAPTGSAPGSLPVLRWSQSFPSGGTAPPACDAPTISADNSTAVGSLIGGGSDVLAVVVCRSFTPPAAQFFADQGLFGTTTIRRQATLRPRRGTNLTCPECAGSPAVSPTSPQPPSQPSVQPSSQPSWMQDLNSALEPKALPAPQLAPPAEQQLDPAVDPLSQSAPAIDTAPVPQAAAAPDPLTASLPDVEPASLPDLRPGSLPDLQTASPMAPLPAAPGALSEPALESPADPPADAP